jgi:hypothetical protein
MPWSVRVAIASLAVFIAVQTTIALPVVRAGQLGWAQSLLPAVLLLLLLGGLLRGSRLAWLWGRYLGFVLAAFVVVIVIATWRGTPAVAKAILLVGLALPVAGMSVALGRPSAFGWFRLVCPECGARTSRGADFLFRQARCRSCGQTF